MENIDHYISELLYDHDCVIVPGLGGFVANPVSAVFDEEKNMFFPPSKEIGFNSNLKHNDGLLISHIASSVGILYEKAGEFVAEFVSDITGKLKSGKVVSLGKVGELSAGTNGTLIFTPNKNENFDAGSFGLASFHFTPIVPYQRRTYRMHPAVKRTLPVRTRHIAVGIAVVVGLFVFSPDIKNPSVNQAGGIEFMMPVQNSLPAEKAETYNTAAPAKTENVNPSVTEQVKEENNINYFIIAGSFKRMEQADRYSKSLKTNGPINPLIIKSSNGRFRVAVDGFNSKDKALMALKTLRKNKEFKTAWILSQK